MKALPRVSLARHRDIMGRNNCNQYRTVIKLLHKLSEYMYLCACVINPRRGET